MYSFRLLIESVIGLFGMEMQRRFVGRNPWWSACRRNWSWRRKNSSTASSSHLSGHPTQPASSWKSGCSIAPQLCSTAVVISRSCEIRPRNARPDGQLWAYLPLLSQIWNPHAFSNRTCLRSSLCRTTKMSQTSGRGQMLNMWCGCFLGSTQRYHKSEVRTI